MIEWRGDCDETVGIKEMSRYELIAVVLIFAALFIAARWGIKRF
jgi:hypothetical protein